MFFKSYGAQNDQNDQLLVIYLLLNVYVYIRKIDMIGKSFALCYLRMKFVKFMIHLYQSVITSRYLQRKIEISVTFHLFILKSNYNEFEDTNLSLQS